MNKNIIITLLIFVLLIETGFLIYEKNVINKKIPVSNTKPRFPTAGPNASGKGPVTLSKGMNLKDTPVFQFAYPIAPKVLADSTKKALVGWSIVTKTNSDGSISVILTPKDSQDQSQQYIITTGQTLYFIEQTPFDDKPDRDKDLNYRDDYGIIVDNSGIIQ